MNISASQSSITDYYNLTQTTRTENRSPQQSGSVPEDASNSRQVGKGSDAAEKERAGTKGPLDELSDEEQRRCQL